MCRLLLIVLLSSCFLSNFCDAQASSNEKLKQEYISKWKNKRTTAWLLFGSGIICFTAGTISTFGGEGAGGPLLVLAGAGATIASFPMFNSAAKYKRKAAELSLAPIKFPNLAGPLPGHIAASIKLKICL